MKKSGKTEKNQKTSLQNLVGQAAELAEAINAGPEDTAALIDQGRTFVEDVVRVMTVKGRIGSDDQLSLRAWLLREVLNLDKRSLGALLDDDVRAGALMELARDI